ncbi:hypothetical protein [Sphingobium xenophagum]|uniref:hypothetical protein n=1 Tax=Sphingobium xenophagum TaxID=121428 RepID=UPI000475D5CF|nr:hypothetical protein [Sphingobium xenophagum]
MRFTERSRDSSCASNQLRAGVAALAAQPDGQETLFPLGALVLGEALKPAELSCHLALCPEV